MVNIERFNTEATEEIMSLFYNTVREVNIKDYTQEQIEVWAPNDMNYQRWKTRLENSMTFVIKDNEKIVGFTNIEINGYLDCFYIHKDYLKKGIGRKLYEFIEDQAKIIGITEIFTEASITARPFFEKMGFKLIDKNTVSVKGIEMDNYKMNKLLS